MARRRKKQLPVDPVPATIESLSHEGRGVAHLDGKAVFIDNALPGEEVRFVYTSQRKAFDQGRAVDIITPSPDRVEPACPHFLVCGGCSLQHMSAPAQVAHKQAVLLEQFHHVARLEIEDVLPPLTAEQWGYRRKARLGVRFVVKKDKLLIGFRERSSAFLTDMNSCVVLHESVGQHIEDLQALVRSLDAYQHIAQIEVAVGDDLTALVFRNLEELSTDDQAKLIDFAKAFDVQVWLQSKGPDSAMPLWPTGSRLYYALPEYDVELDFLPTDFTQVNYAMNHQMVARAIELLELQPEHNVLDLFCGIGNFSLPLSRKARKVTGIEGSAALVARARENAERNNVTNVDYIAADLTEYMPAADEPVDRLLLDPPRSGALEVVARMKELNPQRIVYVSCNIATLARDAGELVANQGYKLVSAGIMDMFPHTAHVESIAVFERR
ncbi:23S rRNA (uracil(1939)-C(5))-methyltransferase RlmD [Sulfuriflexus sp.]|uniref:23S rRNA (uracil(1939)-C(5))-methyltransferase RlmD n=1 Tax=Sulfuriflexus sp. TaxID=2015443 RepID=UPI0028CF1B3D|nr:23S rRNA (uracil(1939)-C(5))-methyltransferase RlmD [Sulfuriflexus sp.]MDT8404878.1 23S rRNA (uracil(1939)-C(5))-methyltransferase RlmD [Sulfuriflexus sp.]